MSENGKYTFTYWNIPGRGESIRALMAIGGLDFEENFVPLPLPLPNPEDSELIPFDDGTWGQMKNSTPWGSLPTVISDQCRGCIAGRWFFGCHRRHLASSG